MSILLLYPDFIMKKILVLLILCQFSLWSQDYTLIHESTAKIIAGEKAPLKEILMESYKKENESIRPYLVKAISLTMMSSGSKATSSYVSKISKTYSQDLFKFLSLPPLRDNCETCDSFGKTLASCNKCQKGQCRNCKGAGFISYGKGKSLTKRDCNTCKKSGFCGVCKGTEKLATDCRKCKTHGYVYDKTAFKDEATKAWQVLLHKSAELGLLNEFTVDQELLKQDEEANKKGLEWLNEITAKKEQWETQEEERFAAFLESQKKAQPKEEGMGEVVVESYIEGGSTPSLDHLCKEVREYLKAQEKKSKQSFLGSVYGKFLSDIPTVHIVVTEGFTNASHDYRQRAADGFFKFALMRADRNGYAGGIGFKLLDEAGNELGTAQNDTFTVPK